QPFRLGVRDGHAKPSQVRWLSPGGHFIPAARPRRPLAAGRETRAAGDGSQPPSLRRSPVGGRLESPAAHSVPSAPFLGKCQLARGGDTPAAVLAPPRYCTGPPGSPCLWTSLNRGAGE